MRRLRMAPSLLVSGLMAALARYVVPRGQEANAQLAVEDDPAELAGRALDRNFDAKLAQRDVGRVRVKAGTQVAVDILKIAETSREMAQVAKLAERESGKTCAILKTVGSGAIALTFASFDLGGLVLGALFTAFELVLSLESATERGTQRFIDFRKRRRFGRYAAMMRH
jgi:hypothetical protein